MDLCVRVSVLEGPGQRQGITGEWDTALQLPKEDSRPVQEHQGREQQPEEALRGPLTTAWAATGEPRPRLLPSTLAM